LLDAPRLGTRGEAKNLVSLRFLTNQEVDRAMGIEPTRAVLPDLKNKRFDAMANPKCD
jgi:hypothetical protein